MYYFKNLNIDPNSVNSAGTLFELSREDERITKEKEAIEKRKISLQTEQLLVSYTQNNNIVKLQNQLLEERTKREKSEAKFKRINFISSTISIGLSVIALVLSIVFEFIN